MASLFPAMLVSVKKMIALTAHRAVIALAHRRDKIACHPPGCVNASRGNAGASWPKKSKSQIVKIVLTFLTLSESRSEAPNEHLPNNGRAKSEFDAGAKLCRLLTNPHVSILSGKLG
jgi:hypothetical protein